MVCPQSDGVTIPDQFLYQVVNMFTCLHQKTHMPKLVIQYLLIFLFEFES